MSHMENKRIAEENKEIIQSGRFNKETPLKLSKRELAEVIVLSPEYFKKLTREQKSDSFDPEALSIRVLNCDSFTPAKEYSRKGIEDVLVMNFANAIYPGGGYLNGSNAQEEGLCRQSTLYASISSKKAREMYDYNDLIRMPFDSDYMLLSPQVEVFRRKNYSFYHESFVTSVMTAAAPNLYGRAESESLEAIEAIMKHRIRNYLLAANAYGYRHLVLGAWGCGAFGHDARLVSEYYHSILFEEGYGRYFKEIVFAVLDTSPEMYNYRSFLHTFE